MSAPSSNISANPLRGVYRLRFAAAMEADYAQAVLAQRRVPRVLLFLFLGLCFALAPLYQTHFFDVADTAHHWLRQFEAYAVGPLCFAAAYASHRGRPRLLMALIQSVAVVVLWVSPLFLRYLALHGALLYPPAMIGLVVIAIAVFGGFHWHVFSLGSAIVIAAASVQELQLGAPPTQTWVDVNALVLAGLIAICGAYAAEVSHRRAWVNGWVAEKRAASNDGNGADRTPQRAVS